jgi:hypothetical protein
MENNIRLTALQAMSDTILSIAGETDENGVSDCYIISMTRMMPYINGCHSTHTTNKKMLKLRGLPIARIQVTSGKRLGCVGVTSKLWLNGFQLVMRSSVNQLNFSNNTGIEEMIIHC